MGLIGGRYGNRTHITCVEDRSNYHYTNPPYETGFSLFMSCARHMTRLRAISTSCHSGWRHASIVSWVANPSKSIDPYTLLFSAVSVISILNFILDLS